MNPRQILNNYRLGKMPSTMYRRGGSKRMPGYGMGGSRKPVYQNQGQYTQEEMQVMQNMQTLEEKMGPDRLQLVEAANAMAQELLSDGTYKRPKKALKYAMEVYGLTTPKDRKHLLDYVNAIGTITAPIIPAIMNRNMNQGNNDPFTRRHGGAQRMGMYQTKGAVSNPSDKKVIMGMMTELIEKTNMDQRSAQEIMGVLSELDATEAIQYLQRINQDVESTRAEKKLLSPDMKRRGGAKRKAKYQNKGEFMPKPIPTIENPMKAKSGMGVPSATQRRNQMKHGGSMCRGLPGGPNEFIR